MKIISWNVNGIRAAYRRGFLKWLRGSKADIICLQEVKAQQEQFPDDLLKIPGYNLYLNPAVKKGYSGTAVYTKKKPEEAEYKLGLKRFDQEGRIIKIRYPNFTLINVYLPHGGRQKENLDYKLKVYQYLFAFLNKIKDKNIILIGDFNIAHQEIDLARPKQNQKNIMFTPEERQRIDKLISFGFTDTFRKFNKEAGHHTWWPYAFNARERNLGWRIDYVFASEKMVSKIKNAFILNKINMSDHCPLGIEI
ncbi:MAG: exodeoxyribonuclease III [Candidatus Omnitrophica bacterium]|nr:exodeoxyribonuclease III [Candidatus Omnitrophota bacterium]